MSNIRSLFLTCHAVDDKSGIGKKVKAQVKALDRAGFEVALSHLGLDEHGQYSKRLIDGELLEEYRDSFLVKRRWKWRLSFDSILRYIVSREIEFLYVRYTHFASPSFIRFLERVKRRGVIVFVEIPTYPYDDEYRDAGKVLRASILVERYSRKSFSNCVDRVVTYSEDASIFGVETLQLDNGVDLQEVKTRISSLNKTGFSILAVSSMEYWHGYDRLISGLQDYCNRGYSNEVTISFAGDINTPTAKEYMNLVSRFGLAEQVKFLGYVSGKELDRLFDSADIAIGVLGGHRKSLQSFKSLKNREYCARGIPFAYSGNDTTFDGQPFAFKVPADESPIDIESLIKWSAGAQHLSSDMRRFAEDRISWDIQMRLVGSEYLKLR